MAAGAVAADHDPGSHDRPSISAGRRAGGRGGGGGIVTDEKERKKEECRFLVNHAKLPLSNNAVNSTQQTILWRQSRLDLSERTANDVIHSAAEFVVFRVRTTTIPTPNEPTRPTDRQRVRLVKKKTVFQQM